MKFKEIEVDIKGEGIGEIEVVVVVGVKAGKQLVDMLEEAGYQINHMTLVLMNVKTCLIVWMAGIVSKQVLVASVYLMKVVVMEVVVSGMELIHQSEAVAVAGAQEEEEAEELKRVGEDNAKKMSKKLYNG